MIRKPAKKSKGPSPTARTLQECRKRGWFAYVTEKRIPHINILRDAFGFGDVLAMDGQPGSLFIQATSTPNMSSREKKIRTECTAAAKAWLAAGNRIEVWGWAQRVHRNKDGSKSKVNRWTLRTVAVVDV